MTLFDRMLTEEGDSGDLRMRYLLLNGLANFS